MSKSKPKNWELNGQFPGIHNPPGKLYIKFMDIVIYTDSLLQPPRVIINGVAKVETHNKVIKWLKENKILYHDENHIKQSAYSTEQNTLSEWLNIIQPLTHIFELSEVPKQKRFKKEMESRGLEITEANEPKDVLFKIYKDTMIIKFSDAIKAINKAYKEVERAITANDKADDFIWNDRVRLPWDFSKVKNILHQKREFLYDLKEEYENVLIKFQSDHKRTGEHKFLCLLLKPVFEKFHQLHISTYTLLGKSRKYNYISPLASLFNIFGYENRIWGDGTNNTTSVRSIIKSVNKY